MIPFARVKNNFFYRLGFFWLLIAYFFRVRYHWLGYLTQFFNPKVQKYHPYSMTS